MPDSATQEVTILVPPPSQDIGNEQPALDITKSLIGARAGTWEELFELYKRHANELGFSCKMTTIRVSKKTSKALERYFMCSCEGQSRFKNDAKITPQNPVEVNDIAFPSPVEQVQNPKRKIKRKRAPTRRTGCKALMRVKLLPKEDVYEVVRHETEHNHEMTMTNWNHLKRSERSISEDKGLFIKQLEEAGIKPTDGYNVLVKASGGEEYVGHTRKDHINFVQMIRMEKIEMGDAQNVVDRLTDIYQQDPGFYFKIKFDDEGRLGTIFWRDSMMKEDYILYGDVVIFDTTYTTNRYNLICAPIVGIYNHWNTVMFGCAFIANEKKETFVWLLEEFRKSMGESEPKTIFTDQDLAMSNAIEEVFEGRTRHRLCIWHIQQNVISHFGQQKNDEEFKKEFDHCLMGCVDKNEFESCWQSMLIKYCLVDNSWFNRLYGLREKWCTSLSKDFFSAGILSSQRSESTNHALCFRANRKTSLTQFFDIFNETIKRWRSEEQRKEFESSSTFPRIELPGGITRHAAKIYTAKIYRFFEMEAKRAFAATYKIFMQTDENNVFYNVAHEKNPEKFETVLFARDDEIITVECTCQQFNAVGWLCFHCIKALNLSNVNKIPENYILKRWTNGAKTQVWDSIYKGMPTTLTSVSTICSKDFGKQFQQRFSSNTTVAMWNGT